MMQRRYGIGSRIIFAFIGLSLLIPSDEVFSCTLFGAIGNRVEGGGVLVGKTRDRPKSSEQVFIEVVPKEGFRYRGISEKGAIRVTSGMNEKGLVVVSAVASNVERNGKITTVGKILSKAASADEVIALVQKGEVRGPISYLVGDLYKIALLEVIDGHHHELLVKENGTLFHTNHFVLGEMRKYNRKMGISSQTRLSRIEAALSQGPFTKDKFISLTQDHTNGPGNLSICRHFVVGVQSSEQTISAAVYYLRKEDLPQIWVSLGQPCQSIFKKH